MNSLLSELERNYNLFTVTNGEIIEMFHFPNDTYNTWRFLLGKANKNYFKRCQELGKNVHKFSKITIKKDNSGKCYLEIIGNDDHTIVIIRNNDSNLEDYKNIVGYKIVEEDFIKEYDFIQRKRLEQLKVPKRFLRDEFLPVDICEEMNIPLLISYYQYINDYTNPVIMFEEPENTSAPQQRLGNETVPRKNPIIDYSLRQKELLKRNPKKVFKFSGRKTGSRYDAYIYERDNFTLAVIEPESGKEYQYNLNLGEVDKNDEELIKEMIKEALQAKEDIVLLDDAIMRKSHTTINAFSENLDLFLENAKKFNKFYYDIKKSNSVYNR